MAFYLSKTAANTTAMVNISPRIRHMMAGNPDFTGDWELTLDCNVTGSSFVALGQGGSGIRVIFFTSLTTLRVARAVGVTDFTLPQSAAGRHTYRIVGSSTANNIEVFQDDVSCGTAATNQLIEVGTMFEFGNSTRFGDIYRVTFTNDGTVVNDYFKETLVGTNDVSFTDGVGGNNGSLVNFPTDNSQWVSFDDGDDTQEISPSSIASAEAFGTATVRAAGLNLEPDGITSLEAIGSPVVASAGVTIAPSAISSQEDVGDPVVSVGLVVISPDSVSSEELVPNPVLTLLLKRILPPSIADTLRVGNPVVFGGDRIVIPIESRENFTTVHRYLRTLSFSGALEDTIKAWLRSEGYDKTWNGSWYDYLDDLGYEGALPDKLTRWRREESGPSQA